MFTRTHRLRGRPRLALLAILLGTTLLVPTVAVAGTPLPPNAKPSVGVAVNDKESLWRSGCLANLAATAPKAGCVFGNPRGTFRVALVGDSHVSHWFPAVEALAKARGWRLETYVKMSCIFVDMRLRKWLGGEYTACAKFRNAVISKLAARPPDLLIIGISRISIFPVRAADSSTTAKTAAFARMIKKLKATNKLILTDTPFPGFDVPRCLAAHRSNIGACAVRNWQRPIYGVLEKGAAKITGAKRIDLAKAGWCGTGINCPTVRNNIIVYRDDHHLTATFARSMWRVLATEIDKVLPSLK